MKDWFNQLTPEFYITTGLILLLFIIMIIVLIQVIRVHRRLGIQDFEIKEAIRRESDGLFYEITIVNRSFSSNHISVIGLRRLNIREALEEKNTIVAPRNKYVTLIPMQEMEDRTITNQKKFYKITIFAENEIGLNRQAKPKKINRHLKKRLKEIKKAEKLAAKQKRFETGNYNSLERTGLFIALLFRPFYKLHLKLKHSTNRTLKESEVRRIQKAEHDRIKYNLEETLARSNEIKVREEAYKENKTRETELELLKQEKVLEIERLKEETLKAEYEKRRALIEAIDPKVEAEKYFEENPIDYEAMDEEIKALSSSVDNDDQEPLVLDDEAEKIEDNPLESETSLEEPNDEIIDEDESNDELETELSGDIEVSDDEVEPIENQESDKKVTKKSKKHKNKK